MRSAEYTPPKHDSSLRLGVKDHKDQYPHKDSKFGCGRPACLEEFFKDIRISPIRSSAMKDFEDCPRKFLYRYKLGIATRKYQPSLFMGNVVHDVLQALFMGKPPKEALNAARQRLHNTCNKILASADEIGFTPSGKSVQKVTEEAEKDYHKGRSMAMCFMHFNPFDWSKWEILHTPEGTPCVELLLEAKVQGIPVPLVAPCDLALRKKGTNEVWIVDHKTTSADTLARARSVKISPQVSLYRLVLQSHLDVWAEEKEAFHGLRVKGSIHNIIKKPGISFCGKDATFQDYIDRVILWYKTEHKKNPDKSPIFQCYTTFTGATLSKEFFLRLRQQARAARAAPDLDRFYRGGDYTCHQFNSVCCYSDLCASSPAMWPSTVRERFDVSYREDEDEEARRHGDT